MRELYKRIAPHVHRVRLDGGAIDNINNLFLLQKSNEGLKDFIQLGFCPELYGVKIRQSGSTNFITKGYDLASKNDLTQTASASQPFLDKVAVNDKLGAKNTKGYNSFLTHNTVSFSQTDNWTVELTLVRTDNVSNISNTVIAGSDSTSFLGFTLGATNGLRFATLYASITDNSVNLIDYGKTATIHIVARNNVLYVYKNGILKTSYAVDTRMAFNRILEGYGGFYNLNGTLYNYHIFSKDLPQSDVLERASILNSIFTEIPSVRIGEQIWSSRNWEASTTPIGSIIPEIQNYSTWATSQTLYDNTYAATSGTVEQKTYAALKAAAMWCHYNNDTAIGATYGKLYNGFARKLIYMDIVYYNAANPNNKWGWNVPLKSEVNTLISNLGGISIAGGKLKETGNARWTNNVGANNESLLSFIPTGVRDGAGVFSGLNINTSIVFYDAGAPYFFQNSGAEILIGTESDVYGRPIRLIKTT